MLTKSPILIIAAISALSFAACVPEPVEPPVEEGDHMEEEMEESEEEESEEVEEEEEMEEEAEMEVEETEEVSSDTVEPASYSAYSEAKYNELKGKKAFALFFHADWCPTCVGIEKAVQEDLANYPAGTTILQANFDTESALKQQYGIQMQSTVVIIDAEGNPVKTLASPANIEIKTALEGVM